MAVDGFKYENYLPAGLKEKELVKEKTKLNRNFNRLRDDSGFDWSRGYDPNYNVEKKGWFSDYDENGVWTRFLTSEEKVAAEKLTASKVQSIRLIKTEHGFMLYDPGMILLNPILLWYLTQGDEVYGAEESDTIKLVEAIKTQLATNNNAKITEIAFGKVEKKKEADAKAAGFTEDENQSFEEAGARLARNCGKPGFFTSAKMCPYPQKKPKLPK